MLLKPEKFFLFSVVAAVASYLLVACSPTPLPSDNKRSNAEKPLPYVSSVNVLSLASSDGADLSTPWNAQDVDLLRLARVLPDNVSPLAITETVVPCSGGGTTTSVVDNQDPPWFSQGDIYTTIYTDCIRGNSTINGQRSFSVDVLIGQQFIDPDWSMTTTMARDVTTTDNTTGLDSTNASNSTVAVEVTNITSYVQNVIGGWSRTQNNNDTQYLDSGEYTVSFTWEDIPGGSYTWDFNVITNSTNPVFPNTVSVTLETLTGINNASPDAGKIQITKTLNGTDSITFVTAIGAGSVLLEVDVDADGIIDTTTETTWQQVMLDPILYQFF